MIISENAEDLITALDKNKVICFKTDTIWGFSTCATSEKAVKKLYAIKNRNPDKPFVSLIKKNQNLEEIVKPLNEIQKKLIKRFWPGPLTIIFETKENLPLVKFFPEKATIALRMPDDELCQQLLSKINYPLPSASANREGETPLDNFKDIANNFKDEDFVLYSPRVNPKIKNTASTIVSTVNNEIKFLRIGDISREEIMNALK